MIYLNDTERQQIMTLKDVSGRFKDAVAGSDKWTYVEWRQWLSDVQHARVVGFDDKGSEVFLYKAKINMFA